MNRLTGVALCIAIAIFGAAHLRGPVTAPVELAPKSPGVLLAADQEPAAGDFVTHEELDELASIFAMRSYSIRCPTPDAWSDDPLSEIAWGYTMLEWNYAVLDPMLCAAALDVAGGGHVEEAWARALAVSVLVHEAYHGRRWGGRANEAAVECKAIRHWSVATRLLGAGDDQVDDLRGWALSHHWRLARLVDEYHLPSCEVPNPW